VHNSCCCVFGPRCTWLPAAGFRVYAHLTMVSTSIPENPKAESPSTATTRRSGLTAAAAMAYPSPTPMVPQVPASSRSLPSFTGSRIILSHILSQCSENGSGLQSMLHVLGKYIWVSGIAVVRCSRSVILAGNLLREYTPVGCLSMTLHNARAAANPYGIFRMANANLVVGMEHEQFRVGVPSARSHLNLPVDQLYLFSYS